MCGETNGVSLSGRADASFHSLGHCLAWLMPVVVTHWVQVLRDEMRAYGVEPNRRTHVVLDKDPIQIDMVPDPSVVASIIWCWCAELKRAH